ncbi:MAG: ATP-binding domain-containing protein, partial [Bacilli bacterium]|nr:ATP-binding domain-containing protein [Bacilli bacterium]
ISLISDVEEYKDDPNRISLMTIHSVKGLEFNPVFVVGLEEGIVPHMNSLMENSELEEERRLAYVAITRAKDDLHLVNARHRTLFGKEQVNPVSRFIGEINNDLLETNVKDELKQSEQKVEVGEMFREEEVDYKVGDYVYHETFGTGKVVEVTGTLISVAFKLPHGVKKLMKNHKKLSKI